jgi:GTPase SAR1 family protein
MFAGRPGVGKTSLLRLLLDTMEVSPRATMQQAEEVARFVWDLMAGGRTERFGEVGVEVVWEGGGAGEGIGIGVGVGIDAESGNGIGNNAGGNGNGGRAVTLNLIDTPPLDDANPATFERSLSEIVRVVESRFVESIDHVSSSFRK